MNHGTKKGLETITKIHEQRRRFTEEVLEENERLRLMLEGYHHTIRETEDKREVEVSRLMALLVQLEEENRKCHETIATMKAQYSRVQTVNSDFAERFQFVERQHRSLLDLYVAVERLHSTLSFPVVLEIVCDIVVNFIGSDCFDVCLFNPDREDFIAICPMNTTTEVGAIVEPHPPIDKALASGTTRVIGSEASMSQVACVPLKLNERLLGAIVIRGLPVTKSDIGENERELFELFGQHAAAAIFTSYLFSNSGLFESPNCWSREIDAIAATLGNRGKLVTGKPTPYVDLEKRL